MQRKLLVPFTAAILSVTTSAVEMNKAHEATQFAQADAIYEELMSFAEIVDPV